MYGPDYERRLGRPLRGDSTLAESPEDELLIDSVGGLRSALDQYVAFHLEETGGLRPLHLVHGTLASDAILALKLRLDSTADQLGQRLKKFSKKSEIGDPFRHLVASMLVSMFGFPGGSAAKEDAEALLRRLDRFMEEKEAEVIIEDETREALTPDLLTDAMEMTAIALAHEDSAIDYLDNPYALASLGMVINPKSQDNIHNFTPPQTLLTVLRGLRKEESAPVLTNWVYDQLSQRPEDCIGFLRVLAQFTAFLDRESFAILYSSGSGEINLLPFRSFHRAVKQAVGYLERLEDPSMDGYIISLKEIEDLITWKFFQVIQGPLQNAVSASAGDALKPSIGEMAFDFTDWAITQMGSGNLSLSEIAYDAVIMLEQAGVDEGGIDTFWREVAEYEPEIGREVRKQAARLGLTSGDRELRREIFEEAVDALKTPWHDAKDIDFARGWREGEKEEDKIIKSDTRLLKVYYIPGTFGPFCRGHYDLVRRIYEYIKTMEASERASQQSHTQRIILVAPITKVSEVTGYEKEPAQVGTIKNRVASILIPLAEMDRKLVFVTTRLQPDPTEAKDADISIADTTMRFAQKIYKDFGGIPIPFTVETVVCVGVDEYFWRKTGEGERLAGQQPAKLLRPSLAVVRYPDLLKTIAAGTDFVSTGTQTIILTPGTPKTHSADAILSLQGGDCSMILLSQVPYVAKYWSRRSIKWREDNLGGATRKRPPSVSTIYRQMFDEYQRLVKGELE